jgi:serine/threonine protein kinase
VNLEARQEPAEPKWQDEVINGVYPLRRRLDESDHSVIFLTECKAQNVPSAALKLVPIERVTLAQLSHWRTASGLFHPHLIRLFDAGLCQLGGRQFLFVVMEYAEQTLAQVLPNRTLTPEEVRKLLPPTLDALAFLHGRELVHGRLKPTNLLVVNDQLKLASDTVCPAGGPTTGIAESSLSDPPEARAGKLSPASDIWSLGVTLVQALTGRLPAWPDERSDTVCLPTGFPSDFSEIVQRCLSRDPSRRPTVVDLQAQLKTVPLDLVTSVTPSVVIEAALKAAPQQSSFRKRAPVLAIGVLIVLLTAMWGGLRLFTHPPNPGLSVASTLRSSPPPTVTPPAAAQKLQVPAEVAAPSANSESLEEIPPLPRGVFRPPDQPAQPQADAAPSSVSHEEIPNAAPSALKTINGHVRVAVLVIVDRAGDVVEANLENPGPSWYFARLAREAAKKWKFVPVDSPDSRTWQLKFVFTRSGATGRATPQP